VRYDVGDKHPLSGRLVPDLTLEDGRRVAELLTTGARSCLTSPAGLRMRRADGPIGLTRSVERSPSRPRGHADPADGYVAWAADSFGPAQEPGLLAALLRWFGPESSG